MPADGSVTGGSHTAATTAFVRQQQPQQQNTTMSSTTAETIFSTGIAFFQIELYGLPFSGESGAQKILRAAFECRTYKRGLKLEPATIPFSK